MYPDLQQILPFFWSEDPFGQPIIIVIYTLLAMSFLTALFHICRYLFFETHSG